MTGSLTVAVAQASFAIGRAEDNLELIEELVAEPAARGSELVVLPELAVTGYTADPASLERAEPIDGPTVDRLGRIAAANDTAIAVSVLERDGHDVFNSGILLDRHGELSTCHRKTHLFGAERLVFTAGDEPVSSARVGSFTVAVLVCYEVEFPEMVRATALAGADLVAVPTATWTYAPGSRFARQVVGARATENNLFVAYANHCGPALDGDYMGGSVIAGPRALIAAEAGGGRQICSAALDLDDRGTGARTVPYLADRRPELYAD